MADAFLRRVMDQRFLEQEAELLDTPPEVFGQQKCRVCGGRCSMSEAGFSPLRVCTACGGRKRQLQLERADAEGAAERRRAEWLVRLAGFHPTPGDEMSDRTCTQCGKKLRADCQHDTCFACRQSGAVAGAEAPPVSRVSRSRKDSLKRFKGVTKALGVDGDELLADFAEAYLKRLADAANPEVSPREL